MSVCNFMDRRSSSFSVSFFSYIFENLSVNYFITFRIFFNHFLTPHFYLTCFSDKEPALVDEFLPHFLEMTLDQLADVRRVLVGFLEDLLKKFPKCKTDHDVDIPQPKLQTFFL